MFVTILIALLLAPVAPNHAQDAPDSTPGTAASGAEGEAATPEDAAALGGESAPPSAGQPRLFKRHADPVVLKGEQLPEFLGTTEDGVRVFSNRDGKLKPIPYQLDERNQWGEFVLEKGKRVVPDEDEGIYDENDEIVFLTKDLGMKTPKEAWPQGFKEAREIEVTDPLTSEKAYAYLFLYVNPSAAPPPSTEDYVSFQEEGSLIRATNYEMGWLKSSSGLDYNHLAVSKVAGGDGINHLDKLKIRVIQSLKRWLALGFAPRLDRTEENFLVKVYGYKDGPVRVLRVLKVNLQLIWKLPAPGATVNYVFYPEWIEIPVPINLPFKPTWAFSNIELDTSHDYNFDPAGGVRGYNSNTPDTWTQVDGKMSEVERGYNSEDVRGAFAGYDATAMGAGAAFFTVRPPRSFSTKIIGLLLDDLTDGVEPEHYKGDGNKKNRPEWIKGSLPMGGFRFVEWESVGRGIHTVYYYQFYPPHYTPGKEKAFLDIIDHPIRVTIN